MAYKDPEKQKAYQRNWYKNRDKAAMVQKNRNDRKARRDVVDSYKTARGCARCGYNKHPAAIDAHHTGTKNFEVSRGIQDCKPIDQILAELELCELVCSNCHRIEHAAKR